MEIQKLTENFLLNPLPLWNNELTEELVNRKLTDLYGSVESGNNQYSLTSLVLGKPSFEKALPFFGMDKLMRIVLPSDTLNLFYSQHGLVPLIGEELLDDAIHNIRRALATFEAVPIIYNFINQIVRSVQVLESENTETDTSYSHPDIPFSIFISVCKEASSISDIRVAESILHEAMHLQLTLIENIVPVIIAGSKEVYYSPWRGEKRPVRGVLHGLYVFRAVFDFYALLQERLMGEHLLKYLKQRSYDILQEITQLTKFADSPGLTGTGRELVFKLLI